MPVARWRFPQGSAALDTVTPLQKLVIDRMAELNLSFRAAADRAGGLVTHGTINNITQGRSHGSGISDRTIRGLALALDLPYSQDEKAWHETQGITDAPVFKLPKKADKLTPVQRKAVLAYINALLDQQAPR